MNRLKSMLLGRAAFLAGVLWLSALTVSQAWPSSWWMDVQSVRVADGRVGQPVIMYVQREIKRDFTATWGVSVRQLSEGKTFIACAQSAVADYRRGTDLPEVVTLGWWSNGRCETLPAGVYVLQTTWQIHGTGLLPAKTVHSTSNPFKVS